MTIVYARIANRTVADEYAAAQAHVASRPSATTPSPWKRPGEQLYERIMTEL